MSPASVSCGPYEVLAEDEEALAELPDGSVELYAEYPYTVRLGAGASRDTLRDALTVRPGAAEGVLRFRGFVGLAELGPRRLRVRSDKLDESAVERMLDEVCERFGALPFTPDKPTSAEYARVWELGRDARYHAFAFLRDGMRGYGRNRIRAAIERVLAQPHETMCLGEPRLVPSGAVSRFDGRALDAIGAGAEQLDPVEPDSPLAANRLAAALGGAMPRAVRVRPVENTTDNPENRFVVAAIEAMVEVLAQFERQVRRERRPSAAINASEARELADTLRRLRRHRSLERVPAAHHVPLNSTVLRGRPGYRELLRAYGDLFGRSTHAEPHATQGLLELRRADQIYEYWCYFQVVAAVGALLGAPTAVESFDVEPTGAKMKRGYTVRWEGARVTFNERFDWVGSGGEWPGSTSYSLPLQPDVSLHAGGRLHLFDAKLKLLSKEPLGGGTEPSGFKPEDMHKMHAYRDALGADSAWILFPGAESEITEHRRPDHPGDESASPQGVGAVPLRPAGEPEKGLGAVVRRMLS